MTNPALMFNEVVDKLKTTVQEGRSFDAAQVKLVGLEEIREAAGENWTRIKERVRTNSMSFLQGCLGQQDIVIPAGDGFLVIYADESHRDIARESQMLQDSLNAFYLGEEGMQKLRSKVHGVSVDAKNMHAVMSFDGGELHSAGDQKRPPAVNASAVPSPAPNKPPREMLFAPVWNVASEAIACYFASWAYSDKGVRKFGYDPEYRATGKLSGETFLDMDLEMLVRAEHAAAEALAAKRKCLVGYSVHSTTLQRRNLRAAYIQRLSTVPEHLRKFMLARIAEVEPGTPLITLTEWIGALRPVSQRVVAEFHPSERVIDGLSGAGLFSVAAYLPLTGYADTAERRHYAEVLGRWAATLKKQQIRFAVDNVLDPVLLELCCRLGVDSVTSDAVWPVLKAPGGVTSFARGHVQDAFAACRSA